MQPGIIGERDGQASDDGRITRPLAPADSQGYGDGPSGLISRPVPVPSPSAMGRKSKRKCENSHFLMISYFFLPPSARLRHNGLHRVL